METDKIQGGQHPKVAVDFCLQGTVFDVMKRTIRHRGTPGGLQHRLQRVGSQPTPQVPCSLTSHVAVCWGIPEDVSRLGGVH